MQLSAFIDGSNVGVVGGPRPNTMSAVTAMAGRKPQSNIHGPCAPSGFTPLKPAKRSVMRMRAGTSVTEASASSSAPPAEVKAILFDMDGVLCNSEIVSRKYVLILSPTFCHTKKSRPTLCFKLINN